MLKLIIMRALSIVFVLICVFACKEKGEIETAQTLVDKAIQNSCNGNCNRSTISFKFRDRDYISNRINDVFELERISSDSLGIFRDVLSNKGFERFLNDSLVAVADSMAVKYASSVNSVHYFALIPYGLNDAAVQKELIGQTTIKGEPYFEVAVSFAQEQGGKDFDDKFVYWIHKEDYTFDYFAYSYTSDEGGIRFREAYNPRVIEGIRFVDYNNFKPKSLDISLTDLKSQFEKNELILLSKIELDSIRVALKPTI